AIDPKDEDARVGRVINPTDQNDADPAAATAIHGVANVAKPTTAALSGEMLTVKLRYKEPDGDTSKLIQVPVTDGGATLADSSDDFAWAASVASFAMLLRDAAARKVRSPQTADAGVDDADNHVSLRAQGFTMEAVREIAMTATGADPFGYRAEFVSLVDKAMALRP
ncbi:MAG: YfbK domain-containing protein, partial [Phycisphaerae bacterium]